MKRNFLLTSPTTNVKCICIRYQISWNFCSNKFSLYHNFSWI